MFNYLQAISKKPLDYKTNPSPDISIDNKIIIRITFLNILLTKIKDIF